MNHNLHYRLFALALPMILSNITVPLLGLVDTAVIGHLEHAYYLGASTIGATIISAVTWLCGFLRMTTTGLAAQAYGEQNSSQGLLVLTRGLLVSLCIALIMLVLQVPFINVAIELSGGSEQVQLYAAQYSFIRIWGLPASLANLVVIGWLLGKHYAKSVMWLLIITNVTNLLLDLLFVVYFQWQVAGIAYATLIAEYLSLFIGLMMIVSKIKPLPIKISAYFREHLLARNALVNYFKLNRDIVLRTLSLQVCFIFITFQGARLGDTVVAANAILMNFLLFISFGLDGIANAAEVMVGKAKGAKDVYQFQQVIKVSLFWTLMFALLYCLVFYLGGSYFIRLISSIESVVLFAEQYLAWIVMLPLIACWSYLFDGVYIGLTEAKVMRNSMIMATFGCFFPIWWLLQDLGNHGLWLAFCCYMAVRGITLAWHLKSRLWYEKTW